MNNEFDGIFPGFDGNVEANGEGNGGLININDSNAISITANSSNNVGGILFSNPGSLEINEDPITTIDSSTGSLVEGDPKAGFDFGSGFSNYLNRFNEVFSFEGAFKLDQAKINDFFEDVASIFDDLDGNIIGDQTPTDVVTITASGDVIDPPLGPIGGSIFIFIVGSEGDDILNGTNGNDNISGLGGDDLLTGGIGDDTLIGGGDRDIFVLEPEGGTDTITDFEVGFDGIGLSGGLTLDQLSFDGNNIIHEDETLAIITGIDATILTAADFSDIL